MVRYTTEIDAKGDNSAGKVHVSIKLEEKVYQDKIMGDES